MALTEESSKNFKRRNYRLWFVFEDMSRCHVDNGLGWGQKEVGSADGPRPRALGQESEIRLQTHRVGWAAP